jgi:hypothetical protein
MIRFRSRIEINGINPYLLIGAKEVSQLKRQWRGPMPVRFRVSGKRDPPWRINLMPVGDGTFYLYLNGEIRKASNLKVGDLVTIEMQFDDEYKGGPLHPMPSWFGDALYQNPVAQRGWDRLTPSRQKEILRYFAGLRSVEAKQRNLQRALHVLTGGQGRFMARSWNENGTGQRPASRKSRG